MTLPAYSSAAGRVGLAAGFSILSHKNSHDTDTCVVAGVPWWVRDEDNRLEKSLSRAKMPALLAAVLRTLAGPDLSSRVCLRGLEAPSSVCPGAQAEGSRERPELEGGQMAWKSLGETLCSTRAPYWMAAEMTPS